MSGVSLSLRAIALLFDRISGGVASLVDGVGCITTGLLGTAKARSLLSVMTLSGGIVAVMMDGDVVDWSELIE